MISKEKISGLVDELLEGKDIYVVDISVQPGNRIMVFIDGDRNVTIEDCRELSRKVEEKLDRDSEDYDLTVSSFGIDRPLRFRRQYLKNLGKEFEVTLQDGTKLAGKLLSAGEKTIELEPVVKKPAKEPRKENILVTFEDIKTAKIILKFGK